MKYQFMAYLRNSFYVFANTSVVNLNFEVKMVNEMIERPMNVQNVATYQDMSHIRTEIRRLVILGRQRGGD